jgi:hypothetical protein
VDRKLPYISVAVLGLFVLAYLGATGELRPRACVGEAALSTWDPNDGARSAIAALVEAARSGDSAVLAAIAGGEIDSARIADLTTGDSATRIEPPPASDGKGEYAVFRDGELAGLVTVVEQPGGFVVSASRVCG